MSVSKPQWAQHTQRWKFQACVLLKDLNSQTVPNDLLNACLWGLFDLPFLGGAAGAFSPARASSTTHWSGCRVQVWVKVIAPACHLAITPKGFSRRQSKVLTAKSMVKLLGQRSSTAWAGRTGEHKGCFQVGCSRWGAVRATTGYLEENVLPLLRYWLN